MEFLRRADVWNQITRASRTGADENYYEEMQRPMPRRAVVTHAENIIK